MSRKSVEDIREEYHVWKIVQDIADKNFLAAENKYENAVMKIYYLYGGIVLLSSFVVGIITGSVELAIFYLFGAAFFSVFVGMHVFVAIFKVVFKSRLPENPGDEYEHLWAKDKYIDEMKHRLVAAAAGGEIIKVLWDKSTFYTWNFIVKLDEDGKSHEYYAKFFFDDEENMVDVDVSEFVAKYRKAA